jgi:hypothetical protein
MNFLQLLEKIAITIMNQELNLKQISSSQLRALYANRKRLSKSLIHAVDMEMQTRGVTDMPNDQHFDSTARAEEPLPLKYKLAIVFLDPLILSFIPLLKTIYLVVRNAIIANAEGRGYRRRAKDSWNYLIAGYAFYTALGIIYILVRLYHISNSPEILHP